MAMKDGYQFQSIFPYSVRNDKRGIDDDEFSRPGDPSRPSHFGLGLQKLDGLQNALRNESRVLVRVVSDIRPERYQVPDSSP